MNPHGSCPGDAPVTATWNKTENIRFIRVPLQALHDTGSPAHKQSMCPGHSGLTGNLCLWEMWANFKLRFIFFSRSECSFQCVSELSFSLQHRVESNVMANELRSDYSRAMLLRLDVGLRSDLWHAPLLPWSLLPPGLPRSCLPLLLYWIDLKMLTWALEHSQAWAWRDEQP